MLRDAGVPGDLASAYRQMNGASIRWSLSGAPDVGGAFKMPSLGRNLKGWARTDFFTDEPERPLRFRVPDEVPLTSKFQHRPCWTSAGEEPMLMWEIYGNTCGDVGLQGFDDYVARGIEHLFCHEWTSLISESDLSREAVQRARVRFGLAEDWSEPFLARIDKAARAQQHARKKQPRPLQLTTFASLFPATGRFEAKSGTPAWRIRGSGVAGPPESAETTRAVLEFLEKSGIKVTRSGSGGIGGGEMYTLDAPFLDGGLFAQTGVYFHGSKSAWITGARAATFIALGLGLKMSPRTVAELGAQGWSLDNLRRQLQELL